MLADYNIWLILFGLLVVGFGAWAGIEYIGRTQSASAKQTMNRAVSIADAIYSQQHAGNLSFLGSQHAATPVAATGAEGEDIVAAWEAAGEGQDFIWWPAATCASAVTDGWRKVTGTCGTAQKTAHDELLGTANDQLIFLYVNTVDLTWDPDGTGTAHGCETASGTAVTCGPFTVPKGQMVRLATADDKGNTYCAVYVRQLLPDAPRNQAVTLDHIGIGYQSVASSTPTDAVAAGTDSYADCGIQGQMHATSGHIATTEMKADLAAVDAGDDGEMPGHGTSSRLDDPS